MADDGQGLQAGLSDPSAAQSSFWKRSKRALGGKSFTFLAHVPKSSKDAPHGDQESDTKAAHSRRREQVRRAQRNHRERKEKYIKTLEREVLRLRDEEAALAQQTKDMREELRFLKDFIASYGIQFPSAKLATINPNATISVLDLPTGGQGLQVEMPSPGFFTAQTEFTSPLSGTGFSGSETTPTADNQSSSYATHSHSHSQSPEKELPALPFSNTAPGQGQQPTLDTAQIAIDFVLTLEQPCLAHTRPLDPSDEGPPSGHALTAQALLLTRAPETLSPNAHWTMPAIEIERLLQLSEGLNLLGELTPVQAWNRIKSYPGLTQFNDAPQRLEQLKQRLRGEVKCYEFGAVVDEVVFEAHLREVFRGPVH